MNVIEILKAEHRVIEGVLACLEQAIDRAEAGEPLDCDTVRKAIEFFRNFADKCHHGKEESQLFPVLESRGIPREGGPIGVMLTEHEQGRACVRGMANNVAAAAGGNTQAVHAVVANARSYINLLRDHIDKEDHCLFAMADQVLNGRDRKILSAAFARVETEEIGQGVHDHLLALAEELGKRFGVDLPVESACGSCQTR